VATLNTDQIILATLNEERLEATIQLFMQSNYVLGCVQELWDVNYRMQFIHGIHTKFPNSIMAPAAVTNCTAGCTSSELDRIVQCLGAENCLALDGLELVTCFITHCRSVHDSLSHSCKSCLGIQTGIDINEKLSKCAGFSDESSTNECVYLFGGESDVVLFSQLPFVAADYLHFTSSPVVDITVVYGQVVFNNQSVHAFCTHLSADLPLINNQPENQAQVQQLVQYVRSKVPPGQLAIIMGDFNNGPAIASANIEGQWVQNYDILSSAFNDVYVTSNNAPLCTTCSDNPLNGLESKGHNRIIDHIFVNKPSSGPGFCLQSASRWADQKVVAQDGGYPVSDHYGVQASFCLS
jgi:endonuclease/exonuclease/phosphatase family metal-dependent hydrolase